MILDPVEYLHVADGVAGRFWHAGSFRLRVLTTLDDLQAEAAVGLVVACRRFDGEKLAITGRFRPEQWLGQRVKWHLIDWYRLACGRDRERPSKRAQRISVLTACSLDAAAPGSTRTLAEVVADPAPGPEELACAAETTACVARLRDGEILLRHAQGETLARIGADIGVTEARICQRVKRGREDLRAVMEVAA